MGGTVVSDFAPVCCEIKSESCQVLHRVVKSRMNHVRSEIDDDAGTS